MWRKLTHFLNLLRDPQFSCMNQLFVREDFRFHSLFLYSLLPQVPDSFLKGVNRLFCLHIFSQYILIVAFQNPLCKMRLLFEQIIELLVLVLYYTHYGNCIVMFAWGHKEAHLDITSQLHIKNSGMQELSKNTQALCFSLKCSALWTATGCALLVVFHLRFLELCGILPQHWGLRPDQWHGQNILRPSASGRHAGLWSGRVTWTLSGCY